LRTTGGHLLLSAACAAVFFACGGQGKSSPGDAGVDVGELREEARHPDTEMDQSDWLNNDSTGGPWDVLPELGDHAGRDLADGDSDGGDSAGGDVGFETVDADAKGVEPVTAAESLILKKIFPTAVEFLAALFDERRYFEARGEAAAEGTAFVGNGYGFDGEVVTITGFDTGGTTRSLEVMSQWESWWYYVESSPWFFEQFAGLDVSKLDPTTRDSGPYQLDAVTGATYSSQAVLDGFWDSVRQYKKWLEVR